MFKGVDLNIAGAKHMLREQLVMVRNSTGAGLKNSRIPDILGDKKIPAGRIFAGPKRGHVQGKEDI